MEWTEWKDEWNGWWLCWRQRYRVIRICELCNDGVQKRREENFKKFYLVFFNSLLFLLLFLLPKLLQGLLTTWLQAQKHIAQMLTSKPMYKESKCMWGCITQCRSSIAIKPCVSVCARAPKT
jgi:hypothetical protein